MNLSKLTKQKADEYYMKIFLQDVLKRELKIRGASINSVSRDCKIPLSVLHGWTQGTLPSAKNLHHLQTLSEYLNITLSVLLFNKREIKDNASVLFSSEFADGELKYKLLIEKITRK